MKYELPKLNYAYDALEPYLDALTMEIHYTKHHQAYGDKMNAVLEKYPALIQSPEELMAGFNSLKMDEADKKVFKDYGGGYINHKLFWQIMDPAKQKNERLVDDIAAAFGSVEAFKEKFNAAAVGQFGSGWAWLVRNQSGGLEAYATANQDSPLLRGHEPILCLDVWEHAYYLKYQNRRAEYVKKWWQVVKLI